MRNLTSLGKITVVKTILLPKITNLFFSLPSPKIDIMKKLNNSFFQYVWGNKRDKTSRKQFIQDYSQGGCRMIDLFTFVKSLKLTLFRRMWNSLEECQFLLYFSTSCDIVKISKTGDMYPIICARKTHNIFWKEALIALHDFMLIAQNKEENIHSIPMLYNSKLCIDNKPLCFKAFFDKGILFINDLLDDTGSLMSFVEFKNVYDIEICYTTYFGVQRTLLKQYPIFRTYRGDFVKYSPNISNSIRILFRDIKGSKSIYDVYISELCYNSSYKEKWEQELNTVNINWQNYNKNIFEGIQDKYLQWLQYRITHRILGKNKSLYTMKIKNSPLCTFCKDTEETIQHFFYDCLYVSRLLLDLVNWINHSQGIHIVLEKKDVLLGIYCRKYPALNTLLLIFKKYIYECKMKEVPLYLDTMKTRIYQYIEIEKFIFKKNNATVKFRTKWDCLSFLYNDVID